MTVVLDASVIVDLLVGPDAETVHATVGDAELHAPAHLDVEVVSALRGLVLGGHLSRSRAADALTDLYDLRIHRWPLGHAMASLTLALAENVTAYDAAYVVLAQALDCRFVTRDRRLARAVETLVEVETV